MGAWSERVRRYGWLGGVAALAVVVATAGVLWAQRRTCDGKAGGLRLVYRIDGKAGEDPAVGERVVKVLRRRLEKVATCVPSVTRQGSEVTIDLPRVDGTRLEGIKVLVGRTGLLEFREVDRGEALARLDRDRLPPGVTVEEERWGGGDGACWKLAGDSVAQLEQAVEALPAGAIPPPLSVVVDPLTPGSEGRPRAQLYLVRPAEVTGASLKDAVVGDDLDGRPMVQVTFDDAGAKKFEELTARLIGRKLAIVFDGRLNSAPIVQTKIPGGRAWITLGSSVLPIAEVRREGDELATLLRSGSLPAPLKKVSEVLVPPLR